MRQLPITRLLAAITWAAIVVSSIQGQDHRFLKITNPDDSQIYAPEATCKVTGILHLPKSKTDIESLLLRFRVYRPRNGTFIIAQETGIRVKESPKGKNAHPFEATLKLPKDDGKYLLRVDCLDLTINGAKGLIATQSIFIELQKTTECE